MTYQRASKNWIPNIEITGVRDFKNIARAMRSDGRIVQFAMSAKAIIECRFDFKSFPIDRQICSIAVKSFDHPESELLLTWDPGQHHVLKHGDLKNNKFFITNSFINKEITNTGKTVLKLSLCMRRFITTSMVDSYAPSFLLVLLAGLSHLLALNAIVPRCNLIMIFMLSMTNIFLQKGDEIPVMNYLSALDIYILVSMVFVASNLVEACLLNNWMIENGAFGGELQCSKSGRHMGRRRACGEIDNLRYLIDFCVQNFKQFFCIFMKFPKVYRKDGLLCILYYLSKP